MVLCPMAARPGLLIPVGYGTVPAMFPVVGPLAQKVGIMKHILISLKHERRFRNELARYTKAGWLVHWYTTDYHYVLELREVR